MNLYSTRLAAAEASKGISADPIYTAALCQMKLLDFNGDLLEFGAGTGHLLQSLLNQGYSGGLTGADILPRPQGLPASVNWIQQDLNLPLSIEAASFDSIVSTEVIEHLENPRSTFRELYRLLRPKGQLLITTPNQGSIRSIVSLVIRGHFVAFSDATYPAHITCLLRKDLERICSESGFATPAFAYTNDGGIPKLPSVKWQNVSFGRLKGSLFSDNLVLVTSKL